MGEGLERGKKGTRWSFLFFWGGRGATSCFLFSFSFFLGGGFFWGGGFHPSLRHTPLFLSCSVTLETREPFLGKAIFSGAATRKKGEAGCH